MRRNGRDQEPAAEPQDDLVTDEEYPVDRLRARVAGSLGGRPFTVYLVLFAGAATLLLLLAVVWISATGDSDDNDLFCTQISAADARVAVLAGQVDRVNILVDDDRPAESLTGIQLRYTDLSCRQTPQGADVREALYSVIGAVEFYNNYNDGSIDLRYQEQEIQSELLATATSTVLPTETATTAPTAAASPIEPTATQVPPTSTSTAPAEPTASPEPTRSPPPTAATSGITSTPEPTADGQNVAPVGDPGV